MNINVSEGTAHKLPNDLKRDLLSDRIALKKWEGLTPLARNEWICWVVSVKKNETRQNHVLRLISELKEGKRRPCCWIGCIHRDDKRISSSVMGIINKTNKP
ncbi:YdeI/OmpD-associated family protein [bacterium]|nr:YdeI/OmpD-associated family protein [bacterium]